MEFVVFILLVAAGFIIRACTQTPPPRGYSWFDIPHASNREARRRRG